MPDRNAPSVSAQNNAVPNAAAQIDRVAVRLPQFIPGDPRLWFCMVDRSFEASGVTTEQTKFGHVLGVLDPRYAQEVRDIISTPPENPYTRLKEELIKRLGASQEENTRRLLESEEIGDRKPSQFLRHLRNLSGGTVDDSVLRTLWISRLPQSMQPIMATQKDVALDKAAEVADAACISTTVQPAHVAEVQPMASFEALINIKIAQMALDLRQEIAAVRRRDYSPANNYRGRSRSRGRDNYDRNRSNSRSSELINGVCWYHHTFGESARKCKPNCPKNSDYQA